MYCGATPTIYHPDSFMIELCTPNYRKTIGTIIQNSQLRAPARWIPSPTLLTSSNRSKWEKDGWSDGRSQGRGRDNHSDHGGCNRNHSNNAIFYVSIIPSGTNLNQITSHHLFEIACPQSNNMWSANSIGGFEASLNRNVYIPKYYQYYIRDVMSALSLPSTHTNSSGRYDWDGLATSINSSSIHTLNLYNRQNPDWFIVDPSSAATSAITVD